MSRSETGRSEPARAKVSGARDEDSPPSPVGQRLEVAVAALLLAIASAGGAVVCATWLTQRIGGVPVPVTIVLAAGWGWTLQNLARQWTSRTLVLITPAVVWILTLVALDSGPGGDRPVPVSLRGLGLLFAGGVLPVWGVLVGSALEAGTGVADTTDAHRG